MAEILPGSQKYLSILLISTSRKPLMERVIEMIAGDLLQLTLVDSPRFRRLMGTCDPCYTYPSRKQLSTKLLKESTYIICVSITDMLNEVTSISMTLDLWSNCQMKSYMSYTAPFFIANCKCFRGRHTSDSINEVFQELLAYYDIFDKVSDVVTDSAANMLRAFANFGLSGFGNEINEDTCGGHHCDRDTAGEPADVDPAAEHPDYIYEFLKRHHSCFAQVNQLVVKNGLKGAPAVLSRVMGKTSKLVSADRSSTIASDVLGGQKHIQTAAETRWNSQLTMLPQCLWD